MKQLEIYNQKGEKAGIFDLPREIFGVKLNSDLVHQVMVSQMSNKRSGTAHTKTRGEVSGGGKKPWRQKGTGRARHGSIRSPLWRHGGTTFGPRNEKNYKKKIDKKAKRKALFMVLSQKAEDNEIFIVDSLELSVPKTKEMFNLIKNVVKNQQNKSLLVAAPSNDQNVMRAAANLKNVLFLNAANLNVLDLLSKKNILLTPDSVETIKKTFLSSKDNDK